MNDRIKLAEAMGWIWQGTVDQPNNPKGQWLSPERGWLERSKKDELLPDPFTDANDCEALIRWLNEHGWIVRISIGSDAADVWIETLANECHDWSGDNWKQGVCELALKVLESVMDSES